jgi:hypothetical protein
VSSNYYGSQAGELADMRKASRCNACDQGCPGYPCDCPCHGSEIADWLASPEGEQWSRQTFKAGDCPLWAGGFFHLKPAE